MSKIRVRWRPFLGAGLCFHPQVVGGAEVLLRMGAGLSLIRSLISFIRTLPS